MVSTVFAPDGKPHRYPNNIGIAQFLDNLNILGINEKYFATSNIIPVFNVISVNNIKGKSEGNTLLKNNSVVFLTDVKLTLP